MKTISFKDIQVVLPHLSQFHMMAKECDGEVNPILHTVGFDLNRGIEYRVCQHRTLKGEAVVGLQIVGEVRTDREFLSSPWATAEDKLIAAGITDRSLGNELSIMMGCTVQYGSVFALEGEENREHWMTQEDIEKLEDEIESLNIVLKDIRGEQRRRDGSLKRPRDYFEVEQFEKVRRKKKDRSTLRHREIV